jgi:hypothetical protein
MTSRNGHAILSGRVVPSNRWRALEVVRSLEDNKVGEAKELREAYDGMYPAPRNNGTAVGAKS